MIRSAIHHWRPVAVATLISAAAILQPFDASPAMTQQRQAQDVHSAGPVSPWPRPIPVRLKPDGRDELFVTTLGTVTTALADGSFDPVADRVTTADGRVIPDYYKRELEIPRKPRSLQTATA